MSQRTSQRRQPPTRLILASGSPRRRQFLEALGVAFEVHIADIDEQNGKGEPPEELVARLSREKVRAVAERFAQAAVIGADTIVTLDGALLGKPVDAADATRMLRALRDRPHQVYSGITLCPPGGAEPRTTVVESTVWMRSYSDDEIAAYVASGDPLDKAGAYAIQNAAFHPVARLRGCFASVMGLPLCELTRLLREIDIVPPVSAPMACLGVTDGPRPPNLEALSDDCCCVIDRGRASDKAGRERRR